MTDADTVRLGREAERLTRDVAFIAAVDRAKAAITAEWQATKPHETDRREELHAELCALTRVTASLQAIATDGQQALDRDQRRSLRL